MIITLHMSNQFVFKFDASTDESLRSATRDELASNIRDGIEASRVVSVLDDFGNESFVNLAQVVSYRVSD